MSTLLRGLRLGDLDLTQWPFGVEFGADLGTPEKVYDVLLSMLADGELLSSDRTTRRTIQFTVLVEGASPAELADNETTLIRECERERSTLTIDAGDGESPLTVFDTFEVQATLQFSDDFEQQNFRRYQLTIPALPYPRGDDLVVTPASPAVTSETLDDCTSTTGWTAEADAGSSAAVSVVSGALHLAFTYGGFAVGSRLVRTGAVDMAGYAYLKVRWKASNGAQVRLWFDRFETGLVSPALTVADTGGYRYSWFAAPPVFSTLVVEVVGVPASYTVDVENIDKVSALPYVGSSRQKVMTLTPGGAVRTSGSLAIEHESNALGTVVAFTHAAGAGYLPALSPSWAAGDTRSTEAGRVSGSKATLTAATEFLIPVTALPEGRAEIWAWLHEATETEFGLLWAVDPYMNGVAVAGGVGGVTKVLLNEKTITADDWGLVPVCEVVLPTGIGPSGYVRVSLQRDPADSELTVSWDEVYLFATDKGRLTVVDCGTSSPTAGGPSKRLWIDGPSKDQPYGGIWRGHSADRSDAIHAGADVRVPHRHDFDPEGSSVFVVTSNAADAATSLSHYRRYHSNAGTL